MTSKRLRRKIKHFSNATTMHGLDQLYSSKSSHARWCWTAVLVAVLGIVVWQMWKIVAFFLGRHTLTDISIVYPDDGLDFPSFTICTLLKINGTRLKKRFPNIKNQIESPFPVAEFSTASFLSAYSTSLMDVNYFGDAGSDAVVDDLQQRFEDLLNGTSLQDYVNDVSFDCESQFLACWFENGQLFPCCNPNTNETGVPIRINRYLLHSGTCYEFESLGLKQTVPGPVGGFGFVYWYPNEHLLASVFNVYDEHAIHLYTSPAEAMLEKSPIALQVGSHSHITLTATKSSRQLVDQLGRSICAPEKLKYFSEYTYPSCQAECLIDGMLDRCNCTGVSTYPHFPEGYICSPKQAFNCYKALVRNFSDMLITCRKEHCSEACVSWSYDPELTIGRVFRPGVEEKMIEYWRLPKTSDPALALIIADIYFPDIEYTDIQQVPALNLESFISNIGNAMGLWTGASIITWIHLVFFCLSAWFIHREEELVRKESSRKERRENLRNFEKEDHGPSRPKAKNSSPHNGQDSSLKRQASEIVLTPTEHDITSTEHDIML